MRQDSSVSLVCFLVGIGAGLAIGIVTAPQSGSATRRLIREKASEAGDYLAVNGREYVDRGRELYDRGRQLADEAAEMFEEGRRLMDKADSTGGPV